MNEDCEDNKNSVESTTSAGVQKRFIGCLFEISFLRNSGMFTKRVFTNEGEIALIRNSLPENSDGSELTSPRSACFDVIYEISPFFGILTISVTMITTLICRGCS